MESVSQVCGMLFVSDVLAVHVSAVLSIFHFEFIVCREVCLLLPASVMPGDFFVSVFLVSILLVVGPFCFCAAVFGGGQEYEYNVADVEGDVERGEE